MACPICDQKPMNCDCTDEEKRLWRAANEFSDEVDRLRLTDAERVAIDAAIRITDAYDDEMDGFSSGVAATLRGLLERTRVATEGE
jgi:hypothetical protein